MTRLKDRKALVTGGSRGIGASIARRLGRDGATVVVNYVNNADAAKSVVSEISAQGGKAYAVKADVSKPAEVARLIDESVKLLGGLDILVNNAGLFEVVPTSEIDMDHVDRLINVNIKGPLFGCKAAISALVKSGHGRIVNLSSVAATGPFEGAAAYAGTKAAVEAITRCLSAELGPMNITVNAVAPGTTDTDMLGNGMTEEAKEAMIDNTILGRLGTPDDIADVVAFLASDEARWVTGQVLTVSGGFRL